MTGPIPAPGAGLVGLFLLGLLGGAHCLGMCGPLVTVYADRMSGGERGPDWHVLRQHLLFNAGRTGAYAAVGTALGALGGAMYAGASTFAVGDAVRAAAGVLAGLAILAAGVHYLTGGGGHGAVGSLPVVGRLGAAVHDRLTARVDRLADGPGVAVLGAAHAALPCPILYPAYLYAFARGSAVDGGLALTAVGLGTFPAVFGVGTALGSLSAASRARLHRALGAVFLVLATVPLSRGLALAGVDVPSVPLPMP